MVENLIFVWRRGERAGPVRLHHMTSWPLCWAFLCQEIIKLRLNVLTLFVPSKHEKRLMTKFRFDLTLLLQDGAIFWWLLVITSLLYMWQFCVRRRSVTARAHSYKPADHQGGSVKFNFTIKIIKVFILYESNENMWLISYHDTSSWVVGNMNHLHQKQKWEKEFISSLPNIYNDYVKSGYMSPCWEGNNKGEQ